MEKSGIPHAGGSLAARPSDARFDTKRRCMSPHGQDSRTVRPCIREATEADGDEWLSMRCALWPYGHRG